jgi:hypothetical protein
MLVAELRALLPVSASRGAAELAAPPGAKRKATRASARAARA